MEIPTHLKDTYRHWEGHVGRTAKPTLTVDEATYSNIKNFIKERLNIWERKWSGQAPPYTEDPILKQYKFCNILREFDKQTIEFHLQLNPIREDFNLWLLNMFYCRMVARPETILKTGLLSFDKEENKKVYKILTTLPRPIYGNAYVFPISTIQRSSFPTRELFITNYLPSVMPIIAREITLLDESSVSDALERILKLFEFNLYFLWTEVLIDVSYQYPAYLDLYKKFPIGPGAKPTMSKLNGGVDPMLLVEDLAKRSLDIGLTYEGKPLCLSAENWEGIGCEFRKYTNLKNGHGRKRLYSS